MDKDSHEWKAHVKKIRSEAGRKGGIAKGKTYRQKKPQRQGQGEIIEAMAKSIERLERQNAALSDKIDRLLDSKIAKPPTRPYQMPTIDRSPGGAWADIAADVHPDTGLDSSRPRRGGFFETIVEDNRELDRLIAAGRKK